MSPGGIEVGSWDILLPALREVLVAVCGGLNDCFAHYCGRPWEFRNAFVTIDDDAASVHLLLRKGSAARRESGSRFGGYAWPLYYHDLDRAEVWRRLGEAGLLPPEDATRGFGPVEGARPARRSDMILFASLGVGAIAHVEGMVRRAGFACIRWSIEHPAVRQAWTGTGSEARLARELDALGVAFSRDGDKARLAIPPADVPLWRKPDGEFRPRERKCADPQHWRNRFAPSYVPARFAAGPCDAEGRWCGREETAS